MHPINNTVDGYNINKALKFLGPRDFGAYRPKGLCKRIANVIHSIAVTLLRILNKIFGDHKWYNNATAKRVVISYFNQPETNPQMTAQIDRLFLSLSSRREGRSGFSYTEGLNLDHLHQAQEALTRLEQPFATIGFYGDLQFQDDTQNKAIKKLFEDKGRVLETGNLNLLEVATQYAKDRDIALSSKKVIQSMLAVDKDMLQSMDLTQFSEGDDKETLLNALAPRQFHPIVPEASATAEEEGMEQDPEGDPTLQSFKDPVDLFKHAVTQAATETRAGGLTDWKPNVYRVAIFNLLKQATVGNDSCHGIYIKFNENLSVSYQKPSLTYERDEDGGFTPKAIYETDILSSREVGCDPESAKQLIDQLNNPEQFLDVLKQANLGKAKLSPKERTLYDLIDTMASQIQTRYASTILKMIQTKNEPQPELQSSTFGEYIAKAKTPDDLMLHAYTKTLQEFATDGYVHEDDYVDPDLGAPNGPFEQLNCKATVWDLVANAEVIDAFTVKFNPYISQPLGTYFIYDPTANLRHTNYLLGGSSETNLDQPATDIIALKAYLEEMTSDEKEILKRFTLAPILKKFCEAHAITDPAVLDSLNWSQMQALRPDRRDLLLKADEQISKMATFTNASYFKKLRREILDTVEFRDDIQAAPMKFGKKVIEKTHQDVLRDFVPQTWHNRITIKSRPVRTTAPTYPTNQHSLNQNRFLALIQQNQIVENNGTCGNCLYRALAMELFNIGPSEDAAQMLREMISTYMQNPAHRAEFTDRVKARYESSGQVARSLEEYCIDLTTTFSWGSEIELEVISQIFGVRIDIFNPDEALRVDTSGEILPNSQFGHKFDGAPIRMIYVNGNHFKPIKMH